MYKFSPKEEIPLDTNVPEAPPSIIIPSDVPIYHAGGLYPSVDPIVPSRSVPPVLGATHVPELSGYADAGSTWPVYSSSLPIVSGYGGTSRSEELIVRVLCPSDMIGRVIGKGGGSIKSVRQASGACIEVDDKVDRDECIISIISTEMGDNGYGSLSSYSSKMYGGDMRIQFGTLLADIALINLPKDYQVGAAKAEQFCKAFRSIHKKLVYEEMSLDAARSFFSSPKSYGE